MAEEKCNEKCMDIVLVTNEVERIYKQNELFREEFALLGKELQNLRRDVDKNLAAIDQIKPALKEFEELRKIVFENGITLKALEESIGKIEKNTSKQRANITTLVVAAVTSIVGPVIVLVFQFLINKP